MGRFTTIAASVRPDTVTVLPLPTSLFAKPGRFEVTET